MVRTVNEGHRDPQASVASEGKSGSTGMAFGNLRRSTIVTSLIRSSSCCDAVVLLNVKQVELS